MGSSEEYGHYYEQLKLALGIACEALEQAIECAEDARNLIAWLEAHEDSEKE